MYKRVELSAISEGLCLLFLPNVPGAMFIQGGTFIPDSRVLYRVVDAGYGLVRSLGDCRPALLKGQKHQMVKAQTEPHQEANSLNKPMEDHGFLFI